MARQQPLELPAEEEVDPHQQDRRHAANVPPSALALQRVSHLETGLELIRRGEYFAAHEELEDAWRAAEPAERDFFQGLVHVAVAWYQAGRGNRVGCERQLEKAARRLGPYAPRAPRRRRRRAARAGRSGRSAWSRAGSLELPALELPAEAERVERAVQRDAQPPVAVEEEQQAERDERRRR